MQKEHNDNHNTGYFEEVANITLKIFIGFILKNKRERRFTITIREVYDSELLLL